MILLVIRLAKYFSGFKFSNNFFKKKIYNVLSIFNENFLFEESKLEYLKNLKKKNNKNINIIIIPFWGDIYNKSFFENLLPSLRTKNNLSWIKKNYNLEVHLFIDKDFQKYQKKYKISDSFLKNNNFKIFFNEDYIDKTRDKKSSIILNAYILHAKLCIQKNAMSINLCSDFILPNDYLKNLALITHGKPFCYTHTQLRVKETISKDIKIFKRKNVLDIDNKNLVSLALKHPFSHLKFQNDYLKKNATHYGISWRKINKNNIAVVHGILGTFTFNFIKEDIEFLSNLDTWSGNDRILPKYLLSSKRMKYISSSNLAVVIELTFKDTPKDLNKLLRENIYNDITKSNSFSSNIWNTTIGSWNT